MILPMSYSEDGPPNKGLPYCILKYYHLLYIILLHKRIWYSSTSISWRRRVLKRGPRGNAD